jgi:hypothetical protein
MTYSLIQVAVEAASSDPRKDNTKMSTLTMPSHHHPHAGFPREFFWPDYRPEVRTLPRPEQEKIALPSIRQVISGSLSSLVYSNKRAGYSRISERHSTRRVSKIAAIDDITYWRFTQWSHDPARICPFS